MKNPTYKPKNFKEKWAHENCERIRNQDNFQTYEEVWIAGFDKAQEKILEILSFSKNPSQATLGNIITLIKAAGKREIGDL